MFLEDGSSGVSLTPGEECPFVPFHVISYHVRILRAVIADWHAYQNDNEFGIDAAWTSNGWPEPTLFDTAWDRWADYMNAALAPFSAHVEIRPNELRNFAGWNRPHIAAYSAMMLQIANDVATGTAWKVCENETCQSLFACQRGRAEAGRSRTTGVMYCTKECARAQAQRQCRRRKQAAKRNDRGKP